jgi:hypothetical protein
MSFLDKLKTPSNETTFTNLIINKLNINKEIYSSTGN